MVFNETPEAVLTLLAQSTDFHGADGYARDQLVARDERSETKVFDATVSQPGVFVEAPSATVVFALQATDAAVLPETQSVTFAFIPTDADAASLSELQSIAFGLVATTDETKTTADSGSLTVVFDVTQSDTFVPGGGQVFTETPSATFALPPTTAETGTFADRPSITGVLTSSITDVTATFVLHHGLRTATEVIADIRSSTTIDKTHTEKLRRGSVYRMLGGRNVVQYVENAVGDIRINWHIPLANNREYGRLYSASLGTFGDRLTFVSPSWGDIPVAFDNQEELRAKKHEPFIFGYEMDIRLVRLT